MVEKMFIPSGGRVLEDLAIGSLLSFCKNIKIKKSTQIRDVCHYQYVWRNGLGGVSYAKSACFLKVKNFVNKTETGAKHFSDKKI